MSFRDTQNPGIGGLDEITDSEALFLQNLSNLSYAQGDILYYDGSALTRLPAGTSGQFLKTQGAGANPIWATGGSGAPTDATYIVQTANATLSNEQALGSLATGILKNTTTTGVLSIAVADTDYLTPTTASTTYVAKSLFDANTILFATTDNTPVALTVGTNTVVGRVAGAITTLAIDADLSTTSAADDTVPSAKATKTALDLKAPLASPTFTGTVTLPVALTGVIRADSGVVSVDTDVTDIVSAASTSAAGKVELATTAEINTGTDTTRAMPVDQFVASNRNVRYVNIRVIKNDTDWSADGTTTIGGDFEIPFTGTITEIGGYVDTAGTTGTAIVDVNLNGATIMTTNKLKWDSTEKSTRTYSGTAPGLTTTAVTAGDIITVDIDTNHTTKSKGLSIRLGIRMT